jgi:hypothetical protein
MCKQTDEALAKANELSEQNKALMGDIERLEAQLIAACAHNNQLTDQNKALQSELQAQECDMAETVPRQQLAEAMVYSSTAVCYHTYIHI